RPLERIDPQLAAEGGTPKPRKLRVDSIRMADATPNVAATKIGASEFGSTCRNIVRLSRAPRAFAATTYSKDFAFRNSPRVRRATPGQFVIPITNIRLRSPGGIKATMVTTRKNVGMVSIISIKREMTTSTTPP